MPNPDQPKKRGPKPRFVDRVRVTFDLEAADLERLNTLSGEQKKDRSEVIREMVRTGLERA